ncbi:MAG: hypothetical protein ACREBJ_06475, partial [Nitrosotalea sp.]
MGLHKDVIELLNSFDWPGVNTAMLHVNDRKEISYKFRILCEKGIRYNRGEIEAEIELHHS